MHEIWHWFISITGANNMGSVNYGLVSGFFGSNLCPNLGVVAVAGMVWRYLRCHQQGCRRVGIHEVVIEGQHYRACHRHHPVHPGEKNHDLRAMWEKGKK